MSGQRKTSEAAQPPVVRPPDVLTVSPTAADAASQPPRPTPTQAYRDLAMAVAQRRAAEPESAVTVTRNARGVFQFEVTVRGVDVLDCIAQAKDTVAELCDLYPYPATNGGTE